MDRIFAFIVAAVISVMLFTACGQTDGASSNVKPELNISEAISAETAVKADEAEETTAESGGDTADVTTAVSASSEKVTVTVTSSAEKKDEVKKTTSVSAASSSETVTEKTAINTNVNTNINANTNTTAADEKNITAKTSSKAENTAIRTTLTYRTEAVRTFEVIHTESVQTFNPTPVPEQPKSTMPVTTTAPEKKEIRFELDLLDTDISEIKSVLGEPVRTGGGLACTQSGNDISVYYYDGLEIQCEVRDDGEFIYDIVITGGGYKTSKNVGTGSRRGDVERAYGKGEISGDSVCYIDGEREMNIIYDGDKVSEIEFYMPV